MEPAANPMTSISLLFVEDDELILKLQASMLAAKFPDVMVYTAANGTLGLELFKAHRPDIVLTDINMSDMGGVHMVDTIRAIKPDTKFIAITGRSAESAENGKFILGNSEGKTAEFDHLIVKPADLSKLVAAVEQCISYIWTARQ